MHKLRSLDQNAKRLQLAMALLAELDQQAERDKIYGKVSIEIAYQEGLADYVRANIETRHK